MITLVGQRSSKKPIGDYLSVFGVAYITARAGDCKVWTADVLELRRLIKVYYFGSFIVGIYNSFADGLLCFWLVISKNWGGCVVQMSLPGRQEMNLCVLENVMYHNVDCPLLVSHHWLVLQ